ncbi:MAG: tRNA (adenosine(37)-N6)-threonylcarbamoyltransferase complex ATPase subunit type 1 TsaE [Flavobacteriaceae bacterium]|jgi:tRNA threonylcarbamoyladenosine biosynthesis protein TsaE
MKIEYDLDEIETTAEAILRNVHSKIVLFKGPMGTGKTTLIKSMVKKLGSTDVVSSPTFAIMNEYSTAETVIYHYDFYRIDSPAEALDFGFDEYLEQKAWNLIEWPDIIVGLLPQEYVVIEISKISDSKRELKLENIK